MPIDISRSMLLESSRALLDDYAAVEVTAIAAEYRAGLRWLERQRDAEAGLVARQQRRQLRSAPRRARFFRGVRATMSPGDGCCMGVDLRKSRAVLEAAYDDAAGVTARFNLNLLARINRELGGGFDLDAFAHARAGTSGSGASRSSSRAARADGADRRAPPRGAVRAPASASTPSRATSTRSPRSSGWRAPGLVVVERWLDAGKRFSVNLLAPLSG